LRLSGTKSGYSGAQEGLEKNNKTMKKKNNKKRPRSLFILTLRTWNYMEPLKQVVKNGQTLADQLDVPAQAVNGRTLVPVRFVTENLGADVSWDQSTYTVVIAFSEERDGMTPEELMLKSNEELMKYNTYKFEGSGTIEIQIQDMNITSGVTMEGQYKKSGDKQEVYLAQTVEFPAIDGSPGRNCQ